MKKIITLSLFLAIAAASFAQTRAESKRVILGAPKGGSSGSSKDVITGTGSNGASTYPTSGTTRQQEIDEVNRAYDSKIAATRNNPLLSAAAKQQRINDLNRDRATRIREINAAYGYGTQGNTNGTSAKKANKAGNGNNGNHYGWEKGKGNPHKSGDSAKKGKGHGGHGDNDD
jgi:hypothetical protein